MVSAVCVNPVLCSSVSGHCHQITIPQHRKQCEYCHAGLGSEQKKCKTSPVITPMGRRAGLRLTRRHNNFLPLFKSPISLAPPFGGSCWDVRDLHIGISSHLGQLGWVQGPTGTGETDTTPKVPSGTRGRNKGTQQVIFWICHPLPPHTVVS